MVQWQSIGTLFGSLTAGNTQKERGGARYLQSYAGIKAASHRALKKALHGLPPGVRFPFIDLVLHQLGAFRSRRMLIE